MDKMTDARAVEVLAAMREDGGAVADADYTAAIDHAIARLREPVRVGGEWVLVPREPNAEQAFAGAAAWNDDGQRAVPFSGECVDRATKTYAAMLAAAPQPPAEAQAQGGGEVWRPMDTAPRDGTLLRLLVDFDDHPTDDTAGHAPTIGANSFDDTGEDVWQFAGWCWTHDHFTEGKGTPVGWLPMLDTAPPSAPVGVGVGDKDCLTTRARELLADEYRKRGIGTGLVNDAGTATTIAIAAIATALAQQPSAVDGAMAGWIADGDTIPDYLIEATRGAIRQEFGNTGTDGYYRRILVRVFRALAAQPGGSDNDR